ncbi:MAG: hypothetical protein HY760_04885, partial [Nitrospirae bacterium]|nr:hypothetical protein [Nitrospirota bacterium]
MKRSIPTDRIRIRLRERLGFRLAVFYTVLIVSVFSAAAWFSFYTAQKALDEELARKLTGIASMVGRSLEAERVLAFRPGDEDTLHYRQWVRHLLEIKESMGVRDIFVFDKDHRVLLDVDGEIAIGREYRLLAIDSVEIQKIWTGEHSASTLYRGSDGHYYKSGYAPLFGPNNTV